MQVAVLWCLVHAIPILQIPETIGNGVKYHLVRQACGIGTLGSHTYLHLSEGHQKEGIEDQRADETGQHTTTTNRWGGVGPKPSYTLT